MTDADRHALLFGPYSTPAFQYGDVVICEVRGEVTLVAMTSSRIPWPIGKRGRAKSHAVFGALADAIRRESATAVCYWWGITPQTVTKWRKAMGVSELTEGTSALKRKNFEEDWAIAARQKAYSKLGDPERRRKIAQAKKGKPRPRHVIDAMAAGRRRKGVSEEARRKMREAAARRRHRTVSSQVDIALRDEFAETLSP